MAALVLSLCVFGFLTVVGYAVLALLAKDEDPLYRLLLAPVTGVSVTTLLLFSGNQVGVPVGRFATGLAIVLAVGAVVVLWRWGRRLPGRDLWPFALFALFALLITGWPMLKFGLDWVSFCNDDMANYCMSAERVLRHGYFQPPGADTVAGRDYTQYTWFVHMQARPGPDLLLAMVSGITGVVTLRLFMPVALTFMLCQITAAGAMTYAAARKRLATWVVVLLVSLSALVALGTLYQLFGQVIGLGLAAGLTSALLRPLDDAPLPAQRARRGALIGLLVAGLIINYVEALPFVALGYFLYAAVSIRGGWAAWRRVLAVLGIGAVTVIVLLNRYVPLATTYVYGQAHSTLAEDPTATIYPYFMTPSGPVFFWGLFPIGQLFPGTGALSALIAGAIALCIASGLLVFRCFRRREAPAFVCIIMVALWADLAHKHAGFGMYKLAMYLQPFILSAVVLGWFSLWRNRLVQVLPLLLLGLGNVSSHLFYTQMSLGSGRAFTEIPSASSTHLVREYADLMKRHPGQPVESDTYNITLAKFQIIESVGRPLEFPSNEFLENMYASKHYPLFVSRKKIEAGIEAGVAYHSSYPREQFQLHAAAGSGGPAVDPFLLALPGHAAVVAADTPDHPLLFVALTGRQVPFNRWHDPEGREGNFRAGPVDDFRDHLIFIASRLGEPYFVAGGRNVSIYQLESDVLFNNRTMAAIGRYLLFQAVNPSNGSRLKLDLTETAAGDGENRLPPADAIGDTRLRFPITGRGSARVFSPPIAPQIIDGRPYIAIDMGVEGDYINYAPRGLMRLWGRSVHLDRRKIVGFVRDVSLVSDAEYRAMRAPTILEHFPEDLIQPTLEYSGLYEDGYVGDRSFVSLSPPAGDAVLVAHGIVPRVNDSSFTTEAVMTVDGRELVRKVLPLGEFDLVAEVPNAPGRRKVELSFSRTQNLPGDDRRPVGAQLTRIGFVSAPSSVSWSATGPDHHMLRFAGIDRDGWMASKASVRLDQPPNADRLVARLMIPKIEDATFSTDVVLIVDDKEVARETAIPGDVEISVGLPAGSTDHQIELSFSRLQKLPAPDGRQVGALLKSIGFERPATGG